MGYGPDRRAGVGLGRRFGTPSVAPLIRLSDGTFVRASKFWWEDDSSARVYEFASGVLPHVGADRFAFSGAITTHIGDDPVDITATGGWTIGDVSGTYTVDRNAAVAPDGATTAARHNFGASANDRASDVGVGFVGGATYRAQVWARTESGTQAFRFRKSDGVVTRSGDLTATTSWQRFDWTFTVQAVPSADQAGITNDSGGIAGAILFWGFDLQDDCPALEPGPVLEAAATVALSDLTIPAALTPLGMFTDGFWLKTRPHYSQAGQVTHGTIQKLIFCASTAAKVQISAAGVYQISDEGGSPTVSADPGAFTAREEVIVVVDFGADELRVKRASGATVTTPLGGGVSWAASGDDVLQIGNNTTTSQPYWGDMSSLWPIDTAPI